jgi:hypothetical protein
MNDWLNLSEVQPARLRDVARMLAAEFDLDQVLQVALAVLSLAAIAMIATTGAWHRWGFIVGLISQPFWIAATWRARNPAGSRLWGMIVLSCCYVFVWILGIGERFPNLF